MESFQEDKRLKSDISFILKHTFLFSAPSLLMICELNFNLKKLRLVQAPLIIIHYITQFNITYVI